MKKILHLAGFLITSFFPALAQEEPVPTPPPATDTAYMRHLMLQPVDIIPVALDIEGMLLLNRDIQTELEGAMDNMYNFKYDLAEQQFRSLRRRYPDHPMPYFLMGLSNWWKIMPTNIQTEKYDDIFFAYMDTAIVKGEELYAKDENNAEAAFFLAAAYGFKARLHSERSHWHKATVASKSSLDYLEKSKTGNGLSPEFMFGQALFNYYAVWIHENYTLLRPVLAFFPDGNKKLGISQLRMVSDHAFYTGTEAKLFLMKIYANEEKSSGDATPIARYLANKYPDNAYFQRFYARLTFLEGNFREAERVSTDILAKLQAQKPGYEAVSGRYATYFLGYINQFKYKDYAKAKTYYNQCIAYAEMNQERESGYFIHAYLNLGRIHAAEGNKSAAKAYYNTVLKLAERKSSAYKEAKGYLRGRG